MIARIGNIKEMRGIENSSLRIKELHCVFTTILKSCQLAESHLRVFKRNFTNRAETQLNTELFGNIRYCY